jgi:type III pantothenate kinase
MIVVVDIGNSRIKWASIDAGVLERSQAALHATWRARDYARLVRGAPEGLLVSSVAARGVEAALRAAARRARVPVTFVRVPRRAAGVTVGYPDPWRLGVDRFVAAVGAHRLFPGLPLLVAGIGTAMTLDLIDARGRHQGGAIIPGPRLMIDSLLTKTHGIRRRAGGGALGRASLFGRSTRDGIERGARFAAAALIERAAEEARVLLGRAPLVVLMGGDAPLVRPLLAAHAVTVPDLVLKGLAVLAVEGRARSRPRR